MASYLRPRRGKKATAESQNIVLKKGEIFFEVPTGGVGKGIGKLKMGDGTTAYKNLPYFLEQRAATDVANSTIAFTATSETNNTTLLNKIANNAKLNVIIPAIKNLLSNLNNSVTQLNNDLENQKYALWSVPITSDEIKPTSNNSRISVLLSGLNKWDVNKYGWFSVWHYEILYTSSHNYQQITFENYNYNDSTKTISVNCMCATTVPFKFNLFPILVMY